MKVLIDKGFSLIEVLIVAAIMSVAGLTMMNMMQYQAKDQKGIENRISAQSVFEDLRATLSNSSNCRATLEMAQSAGFDPRSSTTHAVSLGSGAQYSATRPNVVLGDSGITNNESLFNARYGELISAGSEKYAAGSTNFNNAQLFEIVEFSATPVVPLVGNEGLASIRFRLKTEITNEKLVFGASHFTRDFVVNATYKELNGRPGIISCSTQISDSGVVASIDKKSVESTDSDLIVNRGCPTRVLGEGENLIDWAALRYENFFTVDTLSSPDECHYRTDSHSRWFNSLNKKSPTFGAIPNVYDINDATYHALVVGMLPDGRAKYGFYDAFDPCESDETSIANGLEFNPDSDPEVPGIVVGFNPQTGQPRCVQIDKVADEPFGNPDVEDYQQPTGVVTSDPVDLALCDEHEHMVGYNLESNSIICRHNRKAFDEIMYSNRVGRLLMTTDDSASDLDQFVFHPLQCPEGWTLNRILPNGSAHCTPGYFANGCDINSYVETVNADGSIDCAPLPGGIQNPSGGADPLHYAVGLDENGQWIYRSFASCGANQEMYFDASSGWQCRARTWPNSGNCDDNQVMVGVANDGRPLCEAINSGSACPETANQFVVSFNAQGINRSASSAITFSDCSKVTRSFVNPPPQPAPVPVPPGRLEADKTIIMIRDTRLPELVVIITNEGAQRVNTINLVSGGCSTQVSASALCSSLEPGDSCAVNFGPGSTYSVPSRPDSCTFDIRSSVNTIPITIDLYTDPN